MHILATNQDGRTAPCRARAALPVPHKEDSMEIKHSGSQASAKGPADYFTGAVRIDAPF
jgi:hypothetical protein